MKTHAHECQTLADFLERLVPPEDCPTTRDVFTNAFYQGALCLAVLTIQGGRDNDEAAVERLVDELRPYGLDELIDFCKAHTLQ